MTTVKNSAGTGEGRLGSSGMSFGSLGIISTVTEPFSDSSGLRQNCKDSRLPVVLIAIALDSGPGWVVSEAGLGRQVPMLTTQQRAPPFKNQP